MTEEMRVIICRSAREPLIPGAKLGFECAICQASLQLTDGALNVLRSDGGRLLCNDCGLLYVHLQEDGITRTEMSLNAKTQLAAGIDSPLANWMRKRSKP